MADKEKKKPFMFSSLRRNLVRPSVEETRPMLATPGRPVISTKTTRPLRATENFEISLRDKTDATAKRGFRVQVPKKMLSYFVLVFIVLPLALFLYMEVHRVAASHGHVVHEKVPEHHFHHDVLSLLGADNEEDETNAAAAASLANDTAIVVENGVKTGNTTILGGGTSLNSTLEEHGASTSNATEKATDVVAANQTETDVEEDVAETDKEGSEEAQKRR